MENKEWNEWLRAHIPVVLEKVGIDRGQKVLDFGCGRGSYTLPAAELVGEDGMVYALDKDREALKELEKKIGSAGIDNIETIHSSTPITELREESIDAVLLYDVVHLIEERLKLFKELHLILKPAGFLSIYPMHVERDKFLEQIENYFLLKAEHYRGNILEFVKL